LKNESSFIRIMKNEIAENTTFEIDVFESS